MDEDGEFGRVSKEEDRSIVEDPVPVPFLCIELDGEASRITSRVRRSLLAPDSGESSNAFCLLTDAAQHINGRLLQLAVALVSLSHATYQVADVVCNLELAIGSSSFGVDDPLWDTFTIEMGQQVDQVEVL